MILAAGIYQGSGVDDLELIAVTVDNYTIVKFARILLAYKRALLIMEEHSDEACRIVKPQIKALEDLIAQVCD